MLFSGIHTSTCADCGSFLRRFVEALGLTSPDYYFYLNQSATYRVEGTDDNREFNDTFVSCRAIIRQLVFLLSFPILV